MFNLIQLNKNRKKAVDALKNSDFYKFIHKDIIYRLKPINKDFDQILVVKPLDEEFIKENITVVLPNSNIHYIQDFDQEIIEKKYDLIIFSFGLHWVDDIRTFLFLIKSMLKEDGIFICNFSGAGSLKNLRKRLIELEAAHKIAHSIHISPFIQFEDMTSILHQSGFVENIIDMEPLELEYISPLSLIKDIKKYGEGNVMTNPSPIYSITKKLYTQLGHAEEEAFQDKINLITFIASTRKNAIKLKSEYYYE
jgi:NADH dehydrogenase [ubiquinone] 1 alpha subcomplex assembly factor 5